MTFEVDFLAGIFAIKNDIAHRNGHEVAVFAWADGDDFAALWFFFGSIGDNDAAFGLLIGGRRERDSSSDRRRSAAGWKQVRHRRKPQ